MNGIISQQPTFIEFRLRLSCKVIILWRFDILEFLKATLVKVGHLRRAERQYEASKKKLTF